jgi:hypothetical protein
MKSTVLIAMSILALISLAPMAYSQDQPAPPSSGSPEAAPPQGGGNPMFREAIRKRIMACQNKAAGDACSFTHKGQTIDGTCRQTQRGRLICRRAGEGKPGPAGGAGGGSTDAGSSPSDN